MDNKMCTFFYNHVNAFVANALEEILRFTPNKESIRIAFPDYLIPFYNRGSVLDYNRYTSEIRSTILGVSYHSTWENAITVYHADYPYSQSCDMPVYKMGFVNAEEQDEDFAVFINNLNDYFTFKR